MATSTVAAVEWLTVIASPQSYIATPGPMLSNFRGTLRQKWPPDWQSACSSQVGANKSAIPLEQSNRRISPRHTQARKIRWPVQVARPGAKVARRTRRDQHHIPTSPLSSHLHLPPTRPNRGLRSMDQPCPRDDRLTIAVRTTCAPTQANWICPADGLGTPPMRPLGPARQSASSTG